MKLRLSACFWVLLTVSVFSCRKDELPDYVVDIPPTFQIGIKEKLQPDEENRPLEIHLSSVETLDCQNYRLNYVFHKNGRNLYLTLDDFTLLGPCLPGEIIAKDSFSIGVMKNKNFPLTISLKDVIHNEGSLDVSQSAYTIALKTSYGILNSPEVLRRIPPQTIWGDVIGHKPDAALLAEAFLEELEQMAAALNAQPGYYGHFRIDEKQTVALVGPPNQAGAETFAFAFTGDRDALRDLINTYRSAAPQDLAIRVFASDGVVY